MAHSEKLASWLFLNRKLLNMTVFTGQWVENWLPEFHDLRVEIKLDGNTYRGRGMDQDSDLALTKGGAEAIERAVISQVQAKSTETGHDGGFALHSEEAKAKKNALYELMERDQFLCHFLTKTPFIDLKPSEWKGVRFEHIQKKLAKEWVEIVLKRTLFSKPKTVICFARRVAPTPLGFRGAIGLGTSDSLHESVAKAVIECLTNVVYHLKHPSDSEDFKTFKAKRSYGPAEHGRLYLGNSPECDLSWIFCKSTDKPKKIEWEGWEDKVTFKKLNVPFDILRDAPIHIFKASSKEAQNMFFGPTKKELLNWKRLEQFKGKKLSEQDINWAPHPIA